LTDAQTDALRSILRGLSPEMVADVEHFVLDGTWCMVAVMNGRSGWCAFSQFNRAGMDAQKLTLPGPRIATLLQSFYRQLATETNGP